MHLLNCVVAILLLHLGAAPRSTKAAMGSFIYAGCSPSKYQPNTPFESNLNSLLTSIASTASQGAAYNSFTAGGGDPAAADAAAAYGLYQCRGDLSPGDCVACVQDTVGRLSTVCSNAYAASLQLDGCYVRYDIANFIGRADTTIAYRKCSTSTSHDSGFLTSLDGVLGELQAATGYKVSNSGTVQGIAQCLGDLAAADCTACLAQAMGQLKETCGAALAADVYLAQCYVRYWANGYYFRSSQADYSGDDVGRTVATIIGILAGLALVVVFIAFLRKAC